MISFVLFVCENLYSVIDFTETGGDGYSETMLAKTEKFTFGPGCTTSHSGHFGRGRKL
jgi:hypothetical protein